MVFSLAQRGKQKFRAWRWTGKNDDFMVMHPGGGLAMGSGGGQFALYLGEDFRIGSSGRCLTFENEPLASSPDFRVVEMELFGFNMHCGAAAARLAREDALSR
jgi:hypothetical protein